MGSTMKPTIFNDRVATALKHWHRVAKRNAKDSKHANSTTPFSSCPATPDRGASPIHLLHSYQHSSLDSLPVTPRGSHVQAEHWAVTVVPHSPSPHSHRSSDSTEPDEQDPNLNLNTNPGAVELQSTGSQHSIDISSSDFTFGKWARENSESGQLCSLMF